MDVEDKFVAVTALMCEPSRARMLWNLLDGRAYTATELAAAAGISATSASNHLAKLLDAGLLKVEVQGRHRYFAFATNEVAFVVESLASLAGGTDRKAYVGAEKRDGIRYCRTCYDHLAGYVAVVVADALEHRGFLAKNGKDYVVTISGMEFFRSLGLSSAVFDNSRRPIARQCLDWSERRPHVAGKLGAALLDLFIERGWFERIDFSRELVVTAKARTELKSLFQIESV